MSHATKVQMTDGEEQPTLTAVATRQDPISYEGESVIFDPERMETGFPHIFRFLDHYMAVIKSQDETLNFYYFANPDDEATE